MYKIKLFSTWRSMQDKVGITSFRSSKNAKPPMLWESGSIASSRGWLQNTLIIANFYLGDTLMPAQIGDSTADVDGKL